MLIHALFLSIKQFEKKKFIQWYEPCYLGKISEPSEMFNDFWNV